MPRVSDILFGVRNLLLISLCLLLVSALLASVFGLANLSYPAKSSTNIALWAAVLVGSYTTAKNLPQVDKSWRFGSIVGGAFGVIVFVLMAIVYNISGSLSGQLLLGLLPAIALYAVLGLVGAGVGSIIGSSRKDFYPDR